jgi:hypothetical protein
MSPRQYVDRHLWLLSYIAFVLTLILAVLVAK